MATCPLNPFRPPPSFKSLSRSFSVRPALLRPLSSSSATAVAASPSSSMASPSSKKVLVPIADGTEPMEAVITIDILRRAGADVTVASVEKALQVEASWGIKMAADAFLADVAAASPSFDLISLPGGIPGSEHLRDCGALESLVKKQAEKGGLNAAICAAPAVALGSWGLLKGLKATCYPSFMDKLPSEAAATESRVQVDGQVVTSRGPGTSIEYALVLVEKLYGKDKAMEVAGPMVMLPEHGVEFRMTELNVKEWKFDTTPQVLVPIANGSEEMEAVMIIDILRRAKANVIVASVEDKLEIVASRKVKLIADMLLDEAANREYDLIVLPGKKATAHPSLCDKLSDKSCTDKRVVADGNLITSKGPGTSMEFALSIVEKLFGREVSLSIAKTLVFV